MKCDWHLHNVIPNIIIISDKHSQEKRLRNDIIIIVSKFLIVLKTGQCLFIALKVKINALVVQTVLVVSVSTPQRHCTNNPSRQLFCP